MTASPQHLAEMLAALQIQMDLIQNQLAQSQAQPGSSTDLVARPAPYEAEPVSRSSVRDSESWRRNPRNPRGAFSPGYGVRGTEVDDGPATDLVSESGTVHRVYPAPTEQSPPLNGDEGWPEGPSASENQLPSPTSDPDSRESTLQEQQESPLLRTPGTSQGGGSYIAWQPVVYKNEEYNQADPDAHAHEGLTDCLASMREKREAVRGGIAGVNGPRKGGGGGGCFNCGQGGHISRDCLQPRQSGQKCYNCGKEGHISRDCPNPSNPSRSRSPSNHDSSYASAGGSIAPADDLFASTAHDDGWDNSSSQPATKDSGWGESRTRATPEAPVIVPDYLTTNGWNNDAEPPAPSPIRGQGYINPDRLRMMGRGGAHSSPRQASAYERNRPVPVRQDNGWASRSQRAEPEPMPEAKHSTPPPVVDDEFGGW